MSAKRRTLVERAGAIQALAGVALLGCGVGWLSHPAAGAVAVAAVILGDYFLDRVVDAVRAVKL